MKTTAFISEILFHSHAEKAYFEAASDLLCFCFALKMSLSIAERAFVCACVLHQLKY